MNINTESTLFEKVDSDSDSDRSGYDSKASRVNFWKEIIRADNQLAKYAN